MRHQQSNHYRPTVRSALTWPEIPFANHHLKVRNGSSSQLDNSHIHSTNANNRTLHLTSTNWDPNFTQYLSSPNKSIWSTGSFLPLTHTHSFLLLAFDSSTLPVQNPPHVSPLSKTRHSRHHTSVNPSVVTETSTSTAYSRHPKTKTPCFCRTPISMQTTQFITRQNSISYSLILRTNLQRQQLFLWFEML